MGTKSHKKATGMRIRRLRKSSRISQQTLAAAIGVHVNTVARWESNGIDPRHWALPLIAAALTTPGRIRFVAPHHRSKGGVGIKTNSGGQIKEFDHVDPTLAVLQSGHPRLLLAQAACEFLLPQPARFPLGDQEFD